MASLNPPLADWRGRTAWLVGASSGIGLATAEALATRGARVALSARPSAALAKQGERLARSLVLPLDVTDAGSVKHAFDAFVRAWGVPDLVLCCAGHYQPLHASQFSAAVVRRHLDVNVMGVAHVLEPVLPVLIAAGRGHVSLVGSVAGYRGLPKALAYGPTKAALNNLAEALYLDLQPMGLGVSIVNPGFVETPLTAGNAFRMPALISPAEAAGFMLDGWARGRFEIHFPKRFTWGLKALRVLSDGLYFGAVRRLTGT